MRASHPTKLILAATLAIGASLSTEHAQAQAVGVSVGVSLPPIGFTAAPRLVVLPGTYVYAVPDYEAEIFFYDGFWWRPWEGRWYRSAYYDRGWDIYGSVPAFYSYVPRDWRTHYHRHEWDGRPWNYDTVSYDDARRNWSSWKREKRWDKGREGDRRDANRGDDSYRSVTENARPDRRVEQKETQYRDERAPASKQYRESTPKQQHRESAPKQVHRESAPKQVHREAAPAPRAPASKAKQTHAAPAHTTKQSHSGNRAHSSGGNQKQGNSNASHEKGGGKGPK